jgi:DNA anti-recombination protein RmuC
MKIARAAAVLLATTATFALAACTQEQADRLRAAGDQIEAGAKEAGAVLAEFTAHKREEFAVKLEQARADLDARIAELRTQMESAEGPAKEALAEKIAALEKLKGEVPALVEKLRNQGAANLEQLSKNVQDALAKLPELLKR